MSSQPVPISRDPIADDPSLDLPTANWTPPFREAWRADAGASVVVFLVALPLCLGVALASGAPLLSGIITGIIGGLVVGALSGSHLMVSGPAAGLTAIGAARLRRRRLAGEGWPISGGTTPGRDTVIALVALALVAAPISWYHYQLLQVPAFALALAAALRAGRWGAALATAVLSAALTRHEWIVAIVELYEPDPATALYFTGFLMPLFAVVWFVSRVRAIGDPGSFGSRRPREGPGGARRAS